MRGEAPHALFIFLRADGGLTLDREAVGADARHDRVRDVAVHALDERHHGDDRRDGDDVAEDRQERTELVRSRLR